MKFYRFLTKDTPQNRIRAMILKQRYVPNYGMCKEAESKFSKEVHDKLVNMFLEKDAIFMKGLPRYILVDLAVVENWLAKDDKDINIFLRESGYSKLVDLI